MFSFGQNMICDINDTKKIWPFLLELDYQFIKMTRFLTGNMWMIHH